MFTYYWFPGYILQAMSYFNWITWIAPKNVKLAAITGSVTGLGFNPLPTVDWNQLVVADPLVSPFFVSADSSSRDLHVLTRLPNSEHDECKAPLPKTRWVQSSLTDCSPALFIGLLRRSRHFPHRCRYLVHQHLVHWPPPNQLCRRVRQHRSELQSSTDR